MGLASKLAAGGPQQSGPAAPMQDRTTMVVGSAGAAIAVTDPSGNVSIAAAGVATAQTHQEQQVAADVAQYSRSSVQDRFPEYPRTSMPCSSAPQAADFGSPHHGTHHVSTQQAPYDGQNGSAQRPPEGGIQASSVSQTSSDGSFRASSQFEAVYGNGASGISPAVGSAYGRSPYPGSYPGMSGFSTAISIESMDPDEEVLIVQEVTKEEAQRLLSAGQIDQEVDIDNGGATKKHKLSGRFSRSRKSGNSGAGAAGSTAPADAAAGGHGSASHVEHADLVDVIPVLSQMKSAFQLACGDKAGAKKTQSNMTKGCPGISQIRSVVELAKGDKEAAKATQHQQYVAIKTYGGHMPGVGHAMATYHAGQSMYYRGRANQDKAQLAKAKAKHELTGSTRTLFVGTAGVAGAAMTAGLDGGATAAALGVSAGVTYDGALTLLSGKRKGYFAVAHKARRKDMTPGEIFNAALMPVGDALVAGAAEASADKASVGADGQLVGGDAYGVDAPDGSDANTLDAGEKDAATAVGVLSKLVKPDVADVDPRADAAAAAAAAAGAAAATGVAISAQAAHPQSHMQQGPPSLAHVSMISNAPSDASSTVFQPLQPAHSLGGFSLGSAPSDASFSLGAHGAPPLQQQQQQPVESFRYPRQPPPPGWQLPHCSSAPPLHSPPPVSHAAPPLQPQQAPAVQHSGVYAAPPLHPQPPPVYVGGAAPPLYAPTPAPMTGVNAPPPLRPHLQVAAWSGADAAPPLHPQPPAQPLAGADAAPPLHPLPPAVEWTGSNAPPPLHPQAQVTSTHVAPPLYPQPQAFATHGAPPLQPQPQVTSAYGSPPLQLQQAPAVQHSGVHAASPLCPQPQASPSTAAPPLPPAQQQQLHESMQRVSVGSLQPMPPQQPLPNHASMGAPQMPPPQQPPTLQHNSMGAGDPSAGIIAAGYGLPPPPAKPYHVPEGINTAYLKQQAPSTYHGYAPPNAAAANPYQAKQAEQQYPVQQQYLPQQQPSYNGSLQHQPQPQPYQDQHQYAGQPTLAYPPAPQQQPSSSGSRLAGKLTGMLNSKLHTPF